MLCGVVESGELTVTRTRMQSGRHHSGEGGSVGSPLGGMVTHFWAEAKPTKAAPTRAETTENFIVPVWCCG